MSKHRRRSTQARPHSRAESPAQARPQSPQRTGKRGEAAGGDFKTNAVRFLKSAKETALRVAKSAGKAVVPAVKKGVAAARVAAVKVREKTYPITEPVVRKAYVMSVRVRRAVARHPVSPLLYVTLFVVLLGIGTFRSTYIRAYAVSVDGVEVGTVAAPAEFEETVSNVETRVASVLGTEYDYEAQVTYTPVYAAPAALSDLDKIEDDLFDGAGAYSDVCAVYVNGRLAGYAETEAQVTTLLDELKAPYLTGNVIEVGFQERVELVTTQLPSNATVDVAALVEHLTSYTVEEILYTVEKGDTFNAIAYSHEMTPAMLKELNPDVQIDKLFVGDTLTMQQAVPFLSVHTVTNETYEEVIDSPIEYIDTEDMYRGDTKVKVQGEDGLALVNADVTYLNGMEIDRTVNTSETLKEPTTTVMYRGTKEKPKTASKGRYIWPVSGTLTSRYGYRNIFGSTSFHAGIDIGCSYGKAIKAADGGTVTFSGWQSGYGYLIIITHDNGDKTYYAHNSSLVVSKGDKVYQGQTIAKAGSTGRSTGVHCHFEIRRGGSTVNPLNYLP